MTTDSTAAKWIRGMVKLVFILCYIAFMWASIHHLASFFNDFEESNNNFGSYLVAGAFDITALVSTIAVMFFRKNMPIKIQVIVWLFIIAIAGYSFVINWEYASHYQNMSLAMQQTGETTPVYDAKGVLHYVPVMKTNVSLLAINPVLASGFTIFSLIYSVIAEFFGTKAPDVAELVNKKKYLEETSGLLAEIKLLEEKSKKPSLIQRAKDVAKEVKSAANEIRNDGDMATQSKQNTTPNDADNDVDMDQDMGSFEDDNEVDMAQDIDSFEDDNEGDIDEEPAQNIVLKRNSLGMVEGIMYDQVMANKSVLMELLNEANMGSISDLVLSLQRRFSSHANYINETRVRNVFNAIKADHPELISHPNGTHTEPNTDPEIESVSSPNDPHKAGDNLSDTRTFGDSNEGHMPNNVTDISNAKKKDLDQDMASNLLNNAASNTGDLGAKRGAYAITKEAAANALGCPVSEIERGLTEGIIKPFAKDPDKILRSSLETFVPQKRTRKTAKIAAVK